MKKISIVTFFTFIALLGFKFLIKTDDHQISSWQTFIIDEDKNITHYPSTLEELKFLDPLAYEKVTTENEKESLDKEVKRSPSSKKSENIPQWQESLAYNLMRFQDPQTKLIIKKEESIVRKVNGEKREFDVVLISFFPYANTDFKNSYNALVDTTSGEIIRTWNQSIHEPLRGQRMNFELTPTGHF